MGPGLTRLRSEGPAATEKVEIILYTFKSHPFRWSTASSYPVSRTRILTRAEIARSNAQYVLPSVDFSFGYFTNNVAGLVERNNPK